MKEDTKKCTCCGDDLPLKKFAKHPTSKKGRRPRCIGCQWKLDKQNIEYKKHLKLLARKMGYENCNPCKPLNILTFRNKNIK